MSSPWVNLILQLGISGLVLFVGYKIALKVIAAWRESEKERSLQLRESEKERNAAIAHGFQQDMEAHQQIVTAHQAVVSVIQKVLLWCQRIESKIDTAFDLTPAPVHIETIPPITISRVELTQAKVIVDATLTDREDDDTPVDRPPTATIPKKSPTPPQGSGVVQGRGLYGAAKRPKTQG